jgi:hypothetical protein
LSADTLSLALVVPRYLRSSVKVNTSKANASTRGLIEAF